MEQSSRPARKVAIADHIWDAFEDMASQMGSDRDALINQAMFMFARLNGFLEGSPRAGAAAGGRQAASRGAPPVLQPVAGARSEGSSVRRADEKSHAGRLDEDPQRREVAERVLETAA